MQPVDFRSHGIAIRERFRRAQAEQLESFPPRAYRLKQPRPRWHLIAAAVSVFLVVYLPLQMAAAGMADTLRLVRDALLLALVNMQTLLTAFILLWRPRLRPH